MARKGVAEVKFRVDGETKRRSAYGKTKEEAKEKAIKQKALIEAGLQKQKESPMTVREWGNRWLDVYKEGQIGSNWYQCINGALNNTIYPAIGHRPLKDIREIDLQAIIKSLNKSASYETRVIQILKQMFSKAVQNDLIHKDPSVGIKRTGTAPKGERRIITPLEREYSIKVAKMMPVEGAYVLIMLMCGCRPQEVAALTWDDIDLDAKTIRISKAVKGDNTLGPPKSIAGNRVLAMPELLVEHLRSMDRTSKYVVHNLRGDRLTVTSRRNLFGRFKRQMEIEAGATVFRNKILNPQFGTLTPYMYRHTYCTDMQAIGLPVSITSMQMGHSSLELTAKRYNHQSDMALEESRDAVNKLYDNLYDNKLRY